MTPLERRYRYWLLAYPREYRREHEDDLLATLLDASEPGQEWPSARETAALTAGGLRTRARLAAASPAGMWADGLRLGAVLYLVVFCALAVDASLHPIVLGTPEGVGRAGLLHLEAALLAIGVIALACAAYEIALGAIAGFVVVLAIMLGPFLAVLGGPPAAVHAGSALVGAVVAALAWHPWLRPCRQPWSRRLIELALAGIGVGTLVFLALDTVAMRTTPSLASALVVAPPALLGPVAILVALALVGLDPRPALAATVFAAADATSRIQLIALAHIPALASGGVYFQSTRVAVVTAALAAVVSVMVIGARRRSAIQL